MISKKDIIEIAHPDVKGTKVIELSTLSELRQQLKNRICRKSVMQPCYNCLMIDEMLGVEGEK